MKEPYGITIFCDDIRDEVSNKKTLVGVYSGELILAGELPALIPTFGLSIKYLEPLLMPVEPVNIKVFVPSENEEADVLIDVDLPSDRLQHPSESKGDPLAEYRAHLLYLRISPLVIKSIGHMKVRAYLGERQREIRLGSLRIVQSSERANNEIGLRLKTGADK